MPASTTAIMKNIERLKDQALIDLWNQEATDGRTPGEAWTAFIEAADKLKLADNIPGSVGKAYRKRYADEDPKKAADASAATPGPKTKQAASAASGPAPATAGSKAGGSRRSTRKAAPAAKKEAGE